MLTSAHLMCCVYVKLILLAPNIHLCNYIENWSIVTELANILKWEFYYIVVNMCYRRNGKTNLHRRHTVIIHRLLPLGHFKLTLPIQADRNENGRKCVGKESVLYNDSLL